MSVEIDKELPAQLDERQTNVVQMQDVAQMTIEPGIMRLPVKRVTSAENSDQWAIDLEHPILGELRFFREKPVHGWHDDQEMVKLMHWYDIWDEDPYKLQVEHLYAAYRPHESEYNHDWTLIDPNYDREPTRREKVGQKISNFKNWSNTQLPSRSPLAVWVTNGVFLTLGAALMAANQTLTMVDVMITLPPLYVLIGIMMAMIFTPEDG